ncbi:MAG: hypothetical protein ACRD3R_04220, partial [Terriglobales bacterium]
VLRTLFAIPLTRHFITSSLRHCVTDCSPLIPRPSARYNQGSQILISSLTPFQLAGLEDAIGLPAIVGTGLTCIGAMNP